jgi:hypothetical protein
MSVPRKSKLPARIWWLALVLAVVTAVVSPILLWRHIAQKPPGEYLRLRDERAGYKTRYSDDDPRTNDCFILCLDPDSDAWKKMKRVIGWGGEDADILSIFLYIRPDHSIVKARVNSSAGHLGLAGTEFDASRFPGMNDELISQLQKSMTVEEQKLGLPSPLFLIAWQSAIGMVGLVYLFGYLLIFLPLRFSYASREKRRMQQRFAEESRRAEEARLAELERQKSDRMRLAHAEEVRRIAETERLATEMRIRKIRADCQAFYLLHRADIQERFGPDDFERFLQSHLVGSDIEWIEGRAEVLKQIILSHAEKVDPASKQMTRESLAKWYHQEREAAEAIEDKFARQETISKLEDKYARLQDDYLRRAAP